MSKQDATVFVNYDVGEFMSITIRREKPNSYFGKTISKEQAERAGNILRFNMDFILEGNKNGNA